MPFADIGTDPALARGTSRGTGLYRPADPRRRGRALPAHGVASSLADLFDPARLRDDYTRGAHGPGSMSGHLPGIELAPGERDDLIAYLGTL